jgi:capsular exopolysaccharide synthesis family protein
LQAQAFRRYFRTIIDHVWLVAACVVVTLAVAVAYVTLAPRKYQAQSQLLVSPVNSSDTALVGLPVLHATGDPTQDVLTAASLITTPQVAQAVVNQLHLHESATALLGQVSAAPVGQSNLVAVQATASSAAQAQAIANSFADQVVATRAAALHAAVAALIPGLRSQVAALPPAERVGVGTIGDQLSQLQQLRASGDPTITIAARADLPTAPFSPRTRLALVAALFGGLVIGIGAAFGWDALDPRLRREEQLGELLNLPVLARIPLERHPRKGQPILPGEMSFASAEGYRTLRAVLTSRAGGGPRAFLVTGSAPAEGKTTSAINLAAALAQAGSRVILIEADLRRPTIARALGLTTQYGTEDVLIREAMLDEALTVSRFDGVPIRVLAVRSPRAELADRLSYAIAQRLIQRAKSLADYVIIDSPPLTAVMDALPLAQIADEVVIVAKLGNPRLSQIAEVQQLLIQLGKPGSGVLVIGDTAPRAGYYYGTDNHRQSARAGRGRLPDPDIAQIHTPRN